MALFNENDYLLLNICHAGRCEVELSPGNYVYMSPGTLNVSASPPKSSYCYPGGYYEGILDRAGSYSLSANSDEEVITRDFIASDKADVVCILTDSSQLERSLFMVADYAGIIKRISFSAASCGGGSCSSCTGCSPNAGNDPDGRKGKSGCSGCIPGAELVNMGEMWEIVR